MCVWTCEEMNTCEHLCVCSIRSACVCVCVCVQVNQWCESGVYLLASQAVDKCQSQEGAEAALQDIRRYMDTAEEQQLSALRELYNQHELMLSDYIRVKKPFPEKLLSYPKRLHKQHSHMRLEMSMSVNKCFTYSIVSVWTILLIWKYFVNIQS